MKAPAYVTHLVVTLVVLTGAIWLSTGTMAPYAATLDGPIILDRCDYLANLDHGTFRAPFLMLAGFPRSAWEWSVVLRRILYPLAAFPFMKCLGFEVGGFVLNLLMHWTAFALFVRWLRVRHGDRAAIVAMWMLATFPGIAYWVGMPYSYAAIVPASLLAMMALAGLAAPGGIARVVILSAAIGALALAYDLLPFFGTAALIVLVARRRILHAAIALPCLLAPTAATLALLRIIYAVPPLNSNTAAYGNIVGAYLHPDLAVWWRLLLQLPDLTWKTFLFSNFFFVPLLFAAMWTLPALGRRTHLALEETALLLSGAVLFVFVNAAPPYAGWQIRGEWIPRLYQPVFVAMLLYVARAARTRLSFAAIALAVAGNAIVVVSPALGLAAPLELYHRFYRHGTPGAFAHNLAVFGRRPLGFCRTLEAGTNSLVIEAESFSRGNAVIDRTAAGGGIGVIVSGAQQPVYVEYDVNVPRSGRYRLDLRCATAEARPFRIFVNGKPAGEAPGATKGGFGPDDQRWQTAGTHDLATGPATIRLERDGPLCYLDKLRLTPLDEVPAQ